MGEHLIDLFRLAAAGFERSLRTVRPEQWAAPTPCSEWNVRQLVNHMTRGNLNYVDLLAGASAADFLRMRDTDALGADPIDAYVASARTSADAFARPGAFEKRLDYPLGKIDGRQGIAIRTTDSAIHTWDLARALGVDDTLDPRLVAWMDDNLDATYAGVAEGPTDPGSTHRFFGAPPADPACSASHQDRLLLRMGRRPGLG